MSKEITVEDLMKLGRSERSKIDPIQSALSELQTVFRQAREATDAIEKDPTRTEAAKIVSRANVAKAAKAKVMARREAAEKEALDRLAKADLAVTQAYAAASAAEEVKRASIRQALAGMERVARDELVRQSILDGDMQICRAIATAPRFTSNANHLAYGDAKHLVEKHHAPEAFEERTALREGLASLDDASRNFSAMLDTMTDHKSLEAIQEAQARATKAISTLNGDSPDA